MALYLQNQQTSATWPEPLESTWHLPGGGYASELAPKLPHLGLTDILFMTTIMNLPHHRRPWGMVTWMSDVFCFGQVFYVGCGRSHFPPLWKGLLDNWAVAGVFTAPLPFFGFQPSSSFGGNNGFE